MKKLILTFFILFPSLLFAQSNEYQLLEPLPCIADTGQTCGADGLIKNINTETYIAYVYKFSIAFAAAAAVIMIMYAGFEYATTDIIGNKAAARKRIYNAVTGLIILLASYLILNTIDPRLTDIDTKLNPLDIKGQNFDYNDLVNSANDYQIRHDLDAAQDLAKPLESEAKTQRDLAIKLRNQAVETGNPEEAQALLDKANAAEQKAISLENSAASIRSESALKAVADLGNSLVDSVVYGAISQNEAKKQIADRKASIVGQANKDIEKLKNAGDLEDAQKISEQRDYYVAKIDQDIFLKKQVNAIIKDEKDGVAESFQKSKAQKLYVLIDTYQIPPNVSTAYNQKLKDDKEIAKKEIEAIVNPPKP